MELIHTLLFLIRQDYLEQDKALALQCLKSLEKSTYKTVVIYNQGCLSNEELTDFLSQFDLNCIVIGDASNVGTVIGRQLCFQHIWTNFHENKFISEIHLDMIFTYHWEDPLIDYLKNHDEPIVSAGIVDHGGKMNFLNETVPNMPEDRSQMNAFLVSLRRDKVVHGFTNPCIHVSEILRFTEGYNPAFLRGKQCFEDDSMLLGYFYYYGTKAAWYPKVNYNSVVYHAIAGQRLGMGDSILLNYNGLVKQYGAIGIKHLSQLHHSPWHINFFSQQYAILISNV